MIYIIYFSPNKFNASDEYVQPNLNYIHGELMKVGVTLQLLWEEYVDSCIKQGLNSCSYVTFTRLYGNYSKEKSYTSRIAHKPGEKVEVDWSGPTMFITNYETGKKYKAYLFVATLPYSQLSYVEATYSMDQESWLNCHIHLFEFLGGVPLQIICDNLKTGVIEHPRYGEIVLNDEYLSLAEHYGISIIPTNVRKPKEKPSVEGTVGKIATSVIATLRNETFYSLTGLNEAIKKQVNILNSKNFEKKEGSRLSVFNLEEKHTLLPLPPLPYQVCKWIYNRKVIFNSHVTYKYNWYSVPNNYINGAVDLKISITTIDIYHNKNMIASHKLFPDYQRGKYSTNYDHIPNYKSFKPWTIEEAKEYADKIGANTKTIFERIIGEYKVKEQALVNIVPIIEKSKAYPGDIFERACKDALDKYSLPHYKDIKRCLDKIESPQTIKKKENSNVRGADYYKKEVIK